MLVPRLPAIFLSIRYSAYHQGIIVHQLNDLAPLADDIGGYPLLALLGFGESSVVHLASDGRHVDPPTEMVL